MNLSVTLSTAEGNRLYKQGVAGVNYNVVVLDYDNIIIVSVSTVMHRQYKTFTVH
jgi:hypothetical protein